MKGLSLNQEIKGQPKLGFPDSPRGGRRKVAGSLHSEHETSSNRMQTNHPPLGNKSPNSRAANWGKKRRERGGRRRTGEEEGEQGLSPSPVGKKLKRGKERERRALKRLSQQTVKCPTSKGGSSGAREAATGQTRRLEGFLIERLLEWAF